MIAALVATGDFTEDSLRSKKHVPISRIIASDYPNLKIGVPFKPEPVAVPAMAQVAVPVEDIPIFFAKLAGVGFGLLVLATIVFTLITVF